MWKRICASAGGSSATGGCLPMTNSRSGIRFTTSCAFGPRAARMASRHSSTSASLFPRIWRTSVWKACATVAYGMSRLYWSNLPEAKMPRGSVNTPWSSLTTDDLPTPE